MQGDDDRTPGPKTVIISCRMPVEEAQQFFARADAAGVSHSDALRALIRDGAVVDERAVNAARQEAVHAVLARANQELGVVRAELAETRKARDAWQRRLVDLLEQTWFTGLKLLTAVEYVKRVGFRYKPNVLYWLVRMPRDDPHRILPNLATQLVELLTDISDQTSTRRVDINRDRTKLRRAEWLVWTLSSEVGFSESGEARPMADWLPAKAALDAAKRALEKRYQLGGQSR